MDWISYWNGEPSVYVSRRHKEAHYRAIADGVAELVAAPSGHVLDFGCGETLYAERVAARCGKLYLTDAADTVRAALERRYARHAAIEVLPPEDLAAIPAESLHLIVVNSVVQYLSPELLDDTIGKLMLLLAPAPHGRLVFADIIPPYTGAATDAAALLKFAAANGFLVDAVQGLARTALSDYRKLRATLGLTRFAEHDFIAMLGRHELDATRIHPNLGHNQRRMAFAATRRG